MEQVHKLVLQSRSKLFVFEEKEKLEIMNGSVFYNLLSIEEEMINNLTVVERLFERYSKEKNAFRIGDTWCRLCEQEVGFLLGLRPSGKVFKQKKEIKVDFPEWIINLASKIKELDITIPDKLLQKNNLAKIIKETKLTEENNDSFKKLIYFYVLNFLLFPTSGEKASLKYISYDKDEIEEIDWPKVILENVYADTLSYESTLLKCERLNAILKGDEEEDKVELKEGEVEGEEKEKKYKKVTLNLKFYAPLLEAFYYNRVFSPEAHKQKGPQ